MFIAAPLAIAPIRIVSTRVEGPALIAALVGTARLQIVAAMLLGVGLIV